MSRFDRFKPRSIHEEIREERETCQRCYGTGECVLPRKPERVPLVSFYRCPSCNGTGRVEQEGEEE
jgi:DnaJ-class molecular chaperone